MLKNKPTNRLLNKIVLAGLLVGTLPANLPLNGQAQRAARENLKVEIDQKINDIEKVVNNLNKAKKIIPAIILAVGVVSVLIAVFLGIVAWSYSKEKLVKRLKKSRLSKELLKIDIGFDDLVQQENKLKNKPETISNELLLLKNSLAKLGKKKLYRITILKNIRTRKETELKNIETKLKDIKNKINFVKNAEKNIQSIESQIETDKKKIFFSFIPAIVISIISPILTFAAFKFLSKASIKKASRGLTELEKIEKEFPDILTRQQKNIIAQFKNLYKNPTAIGIIQGIKLKDALSAVANTAMRQQPSLIVLGEQNRAHKIITTYIKLKWQEQELQKAANEHVAMEKSGFKPFTIKLQLNNTKKKIKNLEDRYPMLKKALKNAVLAYTKQVDAILEELREQVIKVVETEKLEKTDLMLQPVIPL